MTQDNLKAEVAKIIKKYNERKTNFFWERIWSDSIAVAKRLEPKLQEDDWDKNSLASFFIKEYDKKKNGQPIGILDDLAQLLKKTHKFDSVKLQQLSYVSSKSSVQDDGAFDLAQNETLAVHRLLRNDTELKAMSTATHVL